MTMVETGLIIVEGVGKTAVFLKKDGLRSIAPPVYWRTIRQNDK